MTSTTVGRHFRGREGVVDPSTVLSTGLLIPRIAIDAPINVDQRDSFNSSLFASDQGFRWTLNNVSFDAFTYK